MKKKLLILLCSLLLSVSLVGCGSENKSENEKNITTEYVTFADREYLLVTHEDEFGHVYVDVETKVQYLHIGRGQYSTMTILIDADGKPILYEGKLEVSDE